MSILYEVRWVVHDSRVQKFMHQVVENSNNIGRAQVSVDIVWLI